MSSSKGVLFLLAFFAVATTLSMWSLYVYRFSALILATSIIISIYIVKKVNGSLLSFGFSKAAVLLCLLVAFLAAYPYIFITPFADASADPASHISSLAVGAAMPQNYEPFSGFEYRYQIGFPVLAKMFIDLLAFVPSNTIVWFLGVVFAFLSSALVYLIAKELFHNEESGLIALALFLGSKIVFQNMYWGQYTFMLASVFFLATFLAFLRKSPLAYLFFPVIIAAHPGVAFYSVIFFALWAIVFRDFGETAKLFLSGLLALPSFFVSYVHFLSNAGAEETVALTLGGLVSNSLIFPLWIGALVFVLAIASISMMLRKKDFGKMQVFLAMVFVVSSLAYLFTSSMGRVIGGRIVELSMFSGLFLSVQLVKGFIERKKSLFLPAVAAIAIVSLALFFTSGQLNHLRAGSKITQEEIGFAHAFKEFDPEYRQTMFLVNNHAKIAELSQKIPFDVMSDWYLSYDKRLTGNDPYLPEAETRHELAERARNGECVECIRQAEFHYVVSTEDYFSSELGFKKVFEYPPYMVFSRQEA